MAKEPTVSLSSADINSIVAALHESDWDEAVVSVGDVKISVARNGAHLPGGSTAMTTPAPVAEPVVAPVAAPAVAVSAPIPSSPAATAYAPANATDFAITAPSIGVLWRSPEPGATPFIEVGQRVEVGDTVCIVEIMKLMNNVASTVTGIVTAVHAENGATVEYGTPLFSVDVTAN
ncbi:acetyl-CoA carboxylase biotin carboxyl carrier protein [Cryobacterium sp. TMS1-13-1]|nr:acetyl-CoA carboxylase biotin carboxyl carrier protein [Cryobacterium sp. TMS1-13-1]